MHDGADDTGHVRIEAQVITTNNQHPMLTPQPLPELRIDDRIGSRDLYPHARIIGNGLVHPVLTRMQFGDVAFDGEGATGPVSIGIERKRIGDLISSLLEGRLVDQQLPGLLETYSHVWLVVEGLYRGNPATGILQHYEDSGKGGGWWRDTRVSGPLSKPTGGLSMYRDLEGWLTSLSLLTGGRVVIKNTYTPQHTTEFAISLCRWFQKPWDQHSGLNSFHTPHQEHVILGKPGLVRRMAKELSGVGWKRSAKVAERFKTPVDMVVATEQDWTEIEGIGKGLARRITNELIGVNIK